MDERIEGTIGRMVLLSIATTAYADHKLLRAFRDFLEDRIENRYGMMATISIQEEGFIEFKAHPPILTLAELDKFALTCLIEFRKNPINEALQ